MSGEAQGAAVDLQAVTGGDPAHSGVRAATELVAFAEAAVAGEEGALAGARSALRGALGDAAVVDAAAVVGNFERMVRIADATGIALDAPVRLLTGDLRHALGIDAFPAGSRGAPAGRVARLAGRLAAPLSGVAFRLWTRRTRPHRHG